MLNILLTSKNIDLTAAFYRAIGETVTPEKHDVGPAHFSFAQSAPEIYPMRKDHQDESVVIRIETTESLEAVMSRVVMVYATYPENVIIEKDRLRKVLILDPDGRSVEIVQMKAPAP